MTEGVDPFIYLVLPRVFALALSMFCLTIVFLGVALGAGFIAGNLVLDSNRTLFEFINPVLASMGLSEFAMIPIKTLAIGFAAALIACLSGFEASGTTRDILVVLPRGMVKVVIAMLGISAFVTLVM